jgi:ABC-type antimicrobial peptide transport system permease subunit
MVRIFEPNEIPKGFLEAIQQRNIDINNVKYVIHEDFKHASLYDILNRFEYHETIPLITEDYIYVIYE